MRNWIIRDRKTEMMIITRHVRSYMNIEKVNNVNKEMQRFKICVVGNIFFCQCNRTKFWIGLAVIVEYSVQNRENKGNSRGNKKN